MSQSQGSPQPGSNRFKSQWGSVVKAAKQKGLTLEKGWNSPDGERLGLVPDFVFEDRSVLCRTADVPFVTEVANCRPLDSSRNTRAGAGVQVLSVDPFHRDQKTLEAVQSINNQWHRRNGADVVTLNHVVSICNTTLCPADEPVPAPRWPLSGPRPPQRQDDAGLGVRVWVIDTGLIDGGPAGEPGRHDAVNPERLYPWLAESPHGQRDPGLRGQPRTSVGPPDLIAEYRGHGTFIAGVLKSVAPGADVTVRNVLDMAGATLELHLGDALMPIFDLPPEEQPDIISLSAGATTLADLELLGLKDFMDKLEPSKILLVAAAGNDGGTTKFWPAAYAADPHGVLSVGALREDGKGRACFSNFGDWVNVYAPGERLVNAFDTGTYRYIDDRESHCLYHPLYQPCTCTNRPAKDEERSFDGMAEWSGTSFATPIVAGRVAAYMSEHHPVPAREAAATLREQANQILDAADKEPLRVMWPR